jgi:hypothetical protein
MAWVIVVIDHPSTGGGKREIKFRTLRREVNLRSGLCR